MKSLVLAVNALFGGVVMTLVVASASMIVLIFSDPGAAGRREGLWGSIFFQSTVVESGGLSAEFGVANWWPLLIVTVVIAVFIWSVGWVFGLLKRYKARLELERTRGAYAGKSESDSDI